MIQVESVAGESYFLERATTLSALRHSPWYPAGKAITTSRASQIHTATNRAGSGLDPNPAGLLGQAWVAVDCSTNQTRGNVYALCSTGGITNLCDVMFARSTNGGASWSAA